MRSISETEDRLQRQVDAVLRGLATAKPGEGFEARLIGNLTRHSVACGVGESREGHRIAAWLAWCRKPRGLALGMVTACCVVMVVGVWVTHRRGGATAHAVIRASRAQEMPSQVLGVSSPRDVTAPVVTARLAISAGKKADPAHVRQVSREDATDLSGSVVMRFADDVPQSAALDEAALRDLRTPSFPAPAMPPTAQERRVRLMLRRGEKHNLAQLDPARGVLSAGQDKAALRSFFEPPRPEIDPFEGVLP